MPGSHRIENPEKETIEYRSNLKWGQRHVVLTPMVVVILESVRTHMSIPIEVVILRRLTSQETPEEVPTSVVQRECLSEGVRERTGGSAR